MRTETRRERYLAKLSLSKKLPVSIATVNFSFDQNVAYLTRAAACFGASSVHIIGKTPDYDTMRRYSGGTNNFMDFLSHRDPLEFLTYVRNNKYKLVSAELSDLAVDINDYEFDTNSHTMLVVGNESDGVPVEIQRAGDVVYIPLPGPGASLNTAQSGNILLYEYTKQFC